MLSMLHSHVKGLAGLICSSSLVATSVAVGRVVHPIVGALPLWGQAVLEWTPVIGAPVGLAGMFFYAISMMFASRTAARQEREAHREELRKMKAVAAEVAAANVATAAGVAKTTLDTAATTARELLAGAAEDVAACVRLRMSGKCPGNIAPSHPTKKVSQRIHHPKKS